MDTQSSKYHVDKKWVMDLQTFYFVILVALQVHQRMFISEDLYQFLPSLILRAEILNDIQHRMARSIRCSVFRRTCIG